MTLGSKCEAALADGHLPILSGPLIDRSQPVPVHIADIGGRESMILIEDLGQLFRDPVKFSGF